MATLTEAIERAKTLMRRAGHAHAVIGGAAIVARARPRLTEDVDLLVAMTPQDVDELIELATDAGYGFDERDREIAAEGLLRLTSSGVDLDLIRADSAFLEHVIERATPLVDGGIPFATLEDLILLKLEAERPIDIDDVLAIRDAAGDRLDRGYIDARANELGLADRVALYLG